MEKTTIKQKKFIRGLLSVLFIFFANQLFYAEPSPSFIKSLVVTKDSKDFFTAQENGYTLRIPDTQPSFVQTDLPRLPEGVQLVSSKREEYLDESGNRGTAIHLWFNFKETGPVQLPPLIVSVKNRTYYLPFEDAMVFENPALISPELTIDFSGSVLQATSGEAAKTIYAKCGQEIIFTVSLKYFVQLISFNSNLPKNSIFKELEHYTVSRGVSQEKEFSTEPAKLATFSWEPLIEGTYSLPEITAVATSYNGAVKTVRLPQYVVQVSKASSFTEKKIFQSKNETSLNGEKIFPSAFKKNNYTQHNEKIRFLSKDDCKKLSELRSLERTSIFNFKARENRIKFEKTLELPIGADEVSKPFVCSLVFLCIFLIAVFLILVFLKKTRIALFVLIFFFASLIFCTWKITQFFPSYAIFSGGVVSPVPEASSQALQNVNGGLRVKILERTENYYYIESKDVNGWVLKDTIYEIR
ncbi:hypothetical protein [Treponema pectinovorum]|uniref:hypothetical protein n=1 Tax=Treponema pectinovorum TaxID=164 RepID=UPI0011CA610A|nr:hypothetical protein [Treponema pectinovorum]